MKRVSVETENSSRKSGREKEKGLKISAITKVKLERDLNDENRHSNVEYEK